MYNLARLDQFNKVVSVLVIGPGFAESDQNAELNEDYLESCARLLCSTSDRFLLTGTAVPQRRNYASPGYLYDPTNDIFMPPSPSPELVWDLEGNGWVPPIPMPTEGFWSWNSAQGAWESVEPPA